VSRPRDFLYAAGEFLLLALAFSLIVVLTACGFSHEVAPIEVKPVEVVHKAGLNFDAVRLYFEEVCALEPDPEECEGEKMEEFVKALSVAMGGSNGTES
jgi:hypothetical protein